MHRMTPSNMSIDQFNLPTNMAKSMVPFSRTVKEEDPRNPNNKNKIQSERFNLVSREGLQGYEAQPGNNHHKVTPNEISP